MDETGMVPRTRRNARLALLVGLAAASSFVWAQLPGVPPEFLDDRRRLHETEITFCYDQRSPTLPLHLDIARALTDTLLLEPVFMELPVVDATERVDGLPIDFDDLYIMMINHCDGFLGRTLSPFGWPDWISFTRPYLRTRYVIVTTGDRGAESLAELPPDQRRIGAVLGSPGDGRLVTYASQGGAWSREGYRRVPLLTEELLYQFLAEDRIDAAVVTEETYLAWVRTRTDGPALGVLAPTPLAPIEFDIAIALLAREIYLRTILDEGIAAIVEQGDVAELIERHGLGGAEP